MLLAGGAYVPLDPSWPVRRLEYIINDTGMPLILTKSKIVPAMARFGKTVLDIDSPPARMNQWEGVLPGQPTADSLAYIMYTSGSTGEPKGVCVTHRGVVRLVKNTNYSDLGPEQVILACAPVTFDAATFEIWGALLNGGTVVVLLDRLPTPRTLERAVKKYGVTTLWLTAGLFHQLVDENPEC